MHLAHENNELETAPPHSTVEKATLDALTATLRGCNAHMGGSAIGKGFRLAARYHLHKRAPLSLPHIDDSALEPGVRHTIEDPFLRASLLRSWRDGNIPSPPPPPTTTTRPPPAAAATTNNNIIGRDGQWR